MPENKRLFRNIPSARQQICQLAFYGGQFRLRQIQFGVFLPQQGVLFAGFLVMVRLQAGELPVAFGQGMFRARKIAEQPG